jgi:hypothetical protein
MARDELDLSDYRPSRVPRVLMVASTLAIMLVAAWFFGPILLVGYSKAAATALFSPKTARVAPAQTPATIATAAAPTAPAEDAAAPVTTTTAASNDNASAPTAPPATENNAVAPWPTTDAPTWPQPDQTASVAPAAPPPTQPAPPATPAAAAPPDAIQLASAAPAETNADTAPPVGTVAANPDGPANVPLPRSRPSRQIAARLAIPLPRPRPVIDSSDVPTPELKAFELQVERMR